MKSPLILLTLDRGIGNGENHLSEQTERGFAFLGYEMDAAGLMGIAPPLLKRFVERANRYYELGADAVRIGTYDGGVGG